MRMGSSALAWAVLPVLMTLTSWSATGVLLYPALWLCLWSFACDCLVLGAWGASRRASTAERRCLKRVGPIYG